MIDLHCHLLPGLDDGAADLATSLMMAKMALAEGTATIACTPHILPGVYPNSGHDIRTATLALQQALEQENIALRLVPGADVHMVPDMIDGLRSGRLLPVADSRYVLVEPPHHVAPPRLEEFFFALLIAGYVPILTHPERLAWIEAHYSVIKRLINGGTWMQVTSGSLLGGFGRRAQYWAHRLLDEAGVHILASDAHDVDRRPPNLARGYEAAAHRIGAIEAEHLVLTRPLGILHNRLPSELPMPGVSVS